MGVLVQHANLPSTMLAGTVGVNVFFVLSGFLITSLLMAEREATGRVDIRQFYERRIRRLVPALVAMLVAVGIVLAVMGKVDSYPGPMLVSLLYVSDVAKAIGFDLGMVGHTWSLAVEEQFYLIWPALMMFMPRRFLLPTVIGGIVIAIVLQVTLIVANDNVLAMFRPDVRMDSILWGCLIALVPIRVPRPIVYLCFAGLLALSFTFFWPYALGLSSLLAAGLVAGAAHMRGVLSNRFLVRVGEISYGLYLWQAIPHGLLESRTLGGNDLIASAMVIVISFALALASERWIELPFRHRRPRLMATPEPAPAIAPESDPAPLPAAAMSPVPPAARARRQSVARG